jgi:DNA-binding transcriptional MerR regulator
VEILRGRRIGFTIAEIREIIQVYKEPPGETGQLKLLMKRVDEKRDELRQKRKDIDETLDELDNVEEACLTRLAELGVGT